MFRPWSACPVAFNHDYGSRAFWLLFKEVLWQLGSQVSSQLIFPLTSEMTRGKGQLSWRVLPSNDSVLRVKLVTEDQQVLTPVSPESEFDRDTDRVFQS